MSSLITAIRNVVKPELAEDTYKQVDPLLDELEDVLSVFDQYPVLKYIRKIHSLNIAAESKKSYSRWLRVVTQDLGSKMFDIAVLEPYLDNKRNARTNEPFPPATKGQIVSALIHVAPADSGPSLEQLLDGYKKLQKGSSEKERKKTVKANLQQKYAHLTLKQFCQKIIDSCRLIRLYAIENPTTEGKNGTIKHPDFP